MIFKKKWENMESKFELQNLGPSEVGFERPTLYVRELEQFDWNSPRNDLINF